MRAIHLSRRAREEHGLGPADLGPRGSLPVDDPAAVRRTAARIEARQAADGAFAASRQATAGELVALGVLHEVFHRLIRTYATAIRPGAIGAAVANLDDVLGVRRVERVRAAFDAEFGDPDTGPAGHQRDLPPSRAAARQEAVEELLLLSLANLNPAAAHLRVLHDDRGLRASTDYPLLLDGLDSFFRGEPGIGPDAAPLTTMLRAPMLAAPTSLAGQLRWIREHWLATIPGLDDLLDRLLLAIDLITEEERGLHLRFGGGGGSLAEAPSFAGADAEPERFSWDSDWMPRLVLMARSTYVWLDQLSRRHGREIRTLDAIPDEELDTLARWGISGLWLIGLWERSAASETIKRWRGNPEAVASAYSLDDYAIAADLGGEDAYRQLRDRAAARGIRLSADMVPNHMGIDSGWVVEHPDWFISVADPPFPAYTYGGADLSRDDRVGIFLEDHYWDDTDAAVVFKRLDRWTGDVRYVYHGNDGTSFPWNDTAQLDYLKPEVREAVIQTILAVARRFPIIRFDAAMVLVRKHIERLWYPEPGAGGAIPSRAEHAMSKAEFERRMPVEFWREVVDRVAAEVPDTLLLAEAFWLLEGYFVRTLGMHRVYNSAFMHMLRDEDNAGYRRVMKDTLEFDPEILKRFVNFMSNPDEKTALEQFGSGDKYAGVATLLATLPGLPMLGHGQVEGFSEKYGMEFRRATREEQPNASLVARHEREIFPLFHLRGRFAEVVDFTLFDLVRDDGSIDDNVFAYSNGTGGLRSVVVFHNRFATTAGRIRDGSPYAVKEADGTKHLESRSLAEALGLPDDPDVVVAWRDLRSGLTFVRTVEAFRTDGLRVELDAYRCLVLLEIRELDPADGTWRRLADRLGGAGVASLEDARRDLELESIHGPLREVLRAPMIRAVIRAVAIDAGLGDEHDPAPAEASTRGAALDLVRREAAFLRAVARAAGAPVGADRAAEVMAAATADAGGSIASRGRSPRDRAVTGVAATAVGRAALAAWLVAGPIAGSQLGGTRFDALRLGGPLAAGLREAGLTESDARAAVDRVRALLGVQDPRRSPRLGRLVASWLADPAIRSMLDAHEWDGAEWIGAEAWDELGAWSAALDALRPPAGLTAAAAAAAGLARAARLRSAGRAAGYRIDRLLADLGPPSAPAHASWSDPGTPASPSVVSESGSPPEGAQARRRGGPNRP